MGKLDNKVAIVTGASRGIGQAIAELYAKEGARVICTARTLHEGEHKLLTGSLETTVAGIKKSGGEATAVTCDVSSEADCEKLFAETHRIYGPADVLVNNAALTYFIPVKDYEPRKWKRSFDINRNPGNAADGSNGSASVGTQPEALVGLLRVRRFHPMFPQMCTPS